MSANPGLKEKLNQDLREAQKSRDANTVSILRMVLAEIHNREIQNQKPVTDEDVLAVLTSSAKKHRDSIAQFESGGRPDLVEKEQQELTLIQKYLPAQLSEEEIKKLVRETTAEMNASTPLDFGKVMGKLMPKIKGQAAGDVVSRILKEELTKT
jgi:uncharacterized protein